jgi:hypothetical protein
MSVSVLYVSSSGSEIACVVFDGTRAAVVLVTPEQENEEFVVQDTKKEEKS